MDDLLVIQKYQVGLELVQANQIGVYHHLHKHSGSTCSLICEDGSRVVLMNSKLISKHCNLRCTLKLPLQIKVILFKCNYAIAADRVTLILEIILK